MGTQTAAVTMLTVTDIHINKWHHDDAYQSVMKLGYLTQLHSFTFTLLISDPGMTVFKRLVFCSNIIISTNNNSSQPRSSGAMQSI